jgi:hypothetical protein
MASASPAARVQIPTRGFPGSGFYRRPDVIAILDADDPYVHRSQGQFGHGAVAGRWQLIGRDLTEPRPEPPVLGGGKTQTANGWHSGLKRVSLTERRQHAAPPNMLHPIGSLCLIGGMTAIRFRQVDEQVAKSG